MDTYNARIYNARIYNGGSHYFWRGNKAELAQLQAKLAAKQTVLPNGRWRYGIEIAQSGIVLSGRDMATTIYRWNWDQLKLSGGLSDDTPLGD